MGEELPTRADFETAPGDLDQKVAWRHFGGKTLAEAYTLFCDNPLHYQEDFMFMGEGALRFYFPVIDQYLRSGAPRTDCYLLECADILALGIGFHFDQHENMCAGCMSRLSHSAIM